MAKILYVDADCDRTREFTRLAAKKGHFVTVATSAERAMLCVEREGGFDAVVLHLILPGIDGAELCRWLERWSCLASVPRVVFTGPETELRIDLTHGLPRWLPAHRYLDSVDTMDRIVAELERVLGF